LLKNSKEANLIGTYGIPFYVPVPIISLVYFPVTFSVPLPYQIAMTIFCDSDLPSGSSSAPEERMQPPVVAGDPSSSSSRERSNSLSHAQQAG
jgi:hypothetical protein